ncbi:MAG: hypothetical protein ACKO7B_17795, partial [Flavobacteriales bacterium]
MNTLHDWDESLFLWLNGHHTHALDTFMWYVSKMWVWLPVYGWMLYSLFKRKTTLNATIALLCIAMLLFLTDF